MPTGIKAAGKWGSIFAIFALIITLIKALIGFVGFLTFAIKLLIALAFVGVFVFVGYLMLKSWQAQRSPVE